MATLKVIRRKMSNTKLKLSDLNPHLMCVLCGGYYIDATTIVECLHSFCRSCIVKHLESSKYCPICEVQVHKTKPLLNIRPDKTLQDIVYKLVPGLFANEMRSRRRFYRERPHYIKPSESESSGEVFGERKIYVNDENITFSLVYEEGGGGARGREVAPPGRNERRYFKCPTGVTVQHLKKLLRAKYDLSESSYKLEIYFREQELHEELTLLDVSYLYLWKTRGTLDLTYKIFENDAKRQKMEESNGEGVAMDGCEEAKAEAKEPEVEEEKEKKEKKKEEEEEKEQQKEKEEEKQATKAVRQEEGVGVPAKENGVAEGEAKEVQLQISESGVISVSQVEDSRVVRTMEETVTKTRTNEMITGVGAGAGAGGEVKRGEKTGGKPSKPYKTIRCSPKTWHPVIPKEKLRPTLMKNSEEPRKPLKFFKMRNMPRFLGNPSSGVKPLFAEAADKPEEKKPEVDRKTVNKILKIDPKTLRPIEKDEPKITSAPSAPNLLTNPFIPNNNHFLFSDLRLLPPHTTNYKDKPSPPAPPSSFKTPLPNGTYPPICFPAPEHSPPPFYPFPPLTKPLSPSSSPPFPFPDKIDPLLRASRLSPFNNLNAFNVAGFHASLPPSISRLLNPHQHFRKINQTTLKRNNHESTKETRKSCDKEAKEEGKEKEKEKEEASSGGEGGERETEVKEKEKEKEKEEEERERERREKERTEENGREEGEKDGGGGGGEERKDVNGETCESASEESCKPENGVSGREKEREKDKDR